MPATPEEKAKWAAENLTEMRKRLEDLRKQYKDGLQYSFNVIEDRMTITRYDGMIAVLDILLSSDYQ